MASNGTVHWGAAFLNQMRQKYGLPPAPPRKGTTTPFQPSLPPPPPGTYDPSIDYESGAATRGLQYTQDDAQTQFETGTEQHNATLADLLTARNNSIADIQRNTAILGHRQADAAAAHGITSAGLLALSQQARVANANRDAARVDASYNTGVQKENAAYAHTFGGYNGLTLTDPYTGQPAVGSLVTSLGRAGTENTFYQQGLNAQKVAQAQANGYVAPSVTTNALGFGRGQASAFSRRQRAAARAPVKGVVR